MTMLGRFRLLVIPWDLTTEWVESEDFVVAGEPR